MTRVSRPNARKKKRKPQTPVGREQGYADVTPTPPGGIRTMNGAALGGYGDSALFFSSADSAARGSF